MTPSRESVEAGAAIVCDHMRQGGFGSFEEALEDLEKHPKRHARQAVDRTVAVVPIASEAGIRSRVDDDKRTVILAPGAAAPGLSCSLDQRVRGTGGLRFLTKVTLRGSSRYSLPCPAPSPPAIRRGRPSRFLPHIRRSCGGWKASLSRPR
jgi:hypothetical protein